MSVFTSQANKTALQNVAQKASGAVNNLLSSNLGQIGVAALMTNKMVQSGISALTTGAAVAASLDNLISGSKADFGSGSPMRTTIDSLNARNKAGDSSSNPETKTMDSKSSTSGGTDLKFPPVPAPYHIVFNFAKYERANPLGSVTFNTSDRIILPIPDQLADNTPVKWGSENLGLSGQVLNAVKNTDQLTSQGAVNLGTEALLSVGAAMAPAEIVQAASSVMGVVPNPALAQLFQGIDFRTHEFSWQFAPKNEAETKIVKDIIWAFKKHSLPTYTSGTAAFFNYPDIVLPEFSKNCKDYLFTFKRCIIAAVNVNYAPQGTPTFFAATKAPVFVQLSISLAEMEYVTQADYGGSMQGKNIDQALFTGLGKAFTKSATQFGEQAGKALSGG
jgi:hypothetical protein